VAEMTGDLRPRRPEVEVTETFEIVEPFRRDHGQT
jgi:hypothetical protein